MSNAYRAVVQSGGGAAVGDATAADVLTGKTFSGAVGSGVSGTMPNQGAVSGTATPSQPYTIPAGYHNGQGTVTATGSAHFDSIENIPANGYPTQTGTFTATHDGIIVLSSNATATSQFSVTVNNIAVPITSAPSHGQSSLWNFYIFNVNAGDIIAWDTGQVGWVMNGYELY